MVCFTPALRKNGLLVVASLLAIVGIFCKRVQLLLGGFQVVNIDLPFATTPMTLEGIGSSTFGAAYQGLVYWPTPLEFGVALGVVALGVAVFLVGLKCLPLRPKQDK